MKCPRCGEPEHPDQCTVPAQGQTLEQILEAALRRVMRANARLGGFKGSITLYEGSPTKDQDCFEAWLELNNAIGQGKIALQAAQIKRDPDVETEAGRPL